MYQSILVGIDFSDTSVETVRWAVSRFPEADITLFHAIDKHGVPGYLERELGSLREEWERVRAGKAPFDFRIWRSLNLILWAQQFEVEFD